MRARIAVARLAGLLFGAGLARSGRNEPPPVRGVLAVAGAWDPTLAFVLAGAVGVSALGYRVARRMGHPLCAPRFDLPTRTDVDARLRVGAALFGVGWGLSGFCPGPALAALPLLLP